MRFYELVFISDPELTEEELEKVADRAKETVEKQKGDIIRVQQWGKKKLAYKVRKQTQGYYTLINFAAPPEAIPELERILKLDERVLKYLIVKLSDKVDVEALRREADEEMKAASQEERPEGEPSEALEAEVSRELGQPETEPQGPEEDEKEETTPA